MVEREPWIAPRTESNLSRVTFVPRALEPFQGFWTWSQTVFISTRQEGEQTMFSLTEIEDGKFIYRCHVCGLDSEIMTTEQAVTYSRSHQCPPNPLTPAVAESSKAS